MHGVCLYTNGCVQWPRPAQGKGMVALSDQGERREREREMETEGSGSKEDHGKVSRTESEALNSHPAHSPSLSFLHEMQT